MTTPIQMRQFTPVVNTFTLGTSIFMLAFAFDFKGEASGGSLVQALMLVAALLGGLVASYTAVVWRRSPYIPRDRGAHLIQWWGVMLFASLLIMLYRKIAPYTYFTTVLPYGLFLVTLTLTKTWLQRGYSVHQLLNLAFFGAILSTIFSFGYGALTSGVSLESIRYQILSPALPFVLGYGVFQYMFGKRNLLVYLSLVASLVPIGLSITRSYLLTLAVVVIAALVTTRFYQRVHLGRFLRLAVTTAVAIALAYFVVTTVRPDFVEDWKHRLIDVSAANNSSDPTTYTRLAEVSWQWQALKESWSTLLFGRGFGATYGWDSQYASIIGPAVGMDAYQEQYTPSGHVPFVYSLFAAGLAFGWLIPGTVLYAVAQALLALRSHLLGRMQVEVVSAMFVVLLAFLSQMFTSNPFGTRYGSILLGLAVAVVLFCRDHHPPSANQQS